ncbi:MAG: hypothetical protein M1281_20630 [Chloroflexi bacterium]|nr:hypothetical protein [Chloroflexota bacterium]
MPVLEFSKDKTPFHALSPAVKFGWGALIMVWLFMIPTPLQMLLFGMVIYAH